jgi:hypothetical protein
VLFLFFGVQISCTKELNIYIELIAGLPSATQVEQEGMNVMEFNFALLRTVEEQSLYIIELEERLAKIEHRLSSLETR